MKKVFLLLILLTSLHLISTSVKNGLSIDEVLFYNSDSEAYSSEKRKAEIDYSFDIVLHSESDSVSITQTTHIPTGKCSDSNYVIFENLPQNWSEESIVLSEIYFEYLGDFSKVAYNGEVSIPRIRNLDTLKIDSLRNIHGYLCSITNQQRHRNDTHEYEIKYGLRLPSKGIKYDFGIALGKLFYFLSDWYYRPVFYKNCEWVNHSDLRLYGNYNLNITTDTSITLGGTAGNITFADSAGKRYYKVTQNNIKEFSWFAGEDIDLFRDTVRLKNGRDITINYYLQDENLGYLKRYQRITPGGISFYDEHLGELNDDVINILELPKTFSSTDRSYPLLIPVSPEFISPEGTHYPEKYILKGITRQYLGNSFIFNKNEHAWIDEALPDYLADVYLYENIGPSDVTFKLGTFYPVYGINFLQYNEIPVIYTLGVYKKEMGTDLLPEYYRNKLTGPLTTPSDLLPDDQSRLINKLHKPYLMLTTLERLMGREKVLKSLSDAYKTRRFEKINGADLVDIFQHNTNIDLRKFRSEMFEKSASYEYRVKYIAEEEKYWKVYLERVGDGVFPMDVAIFTETDTIYQFWDGKSRYKILNIPAETKLEGVELDPERKNLFDSNYADNSYSVDKRFIGPWSISMRWFFWLQNALMILGSIG